MSAPRFTSGPWEVQRVPEYHVAGDTITADLDGPPTTWAIKHTFKPATGGRVTQYVGQAFVLPDRDGEANARLIAAAPELYEALEAVTIFAAATIEKLNLTDTNGIIAAANTTLAKARGES